MPNWSETHRRHESATQLRKHTDQVPVERLTGQTEKRECIMLMGVETANRDPQTELPLQYGDLVGVGYTEKNKVYSRPAIVCFCWNSASPTPQSYFSIYLSIFVAMDLSCALTIAGEAKQISI